MAHLWHVVDKVFATHGYDAHITHAKDGTHGATSLHPAGLALDIRSKHVDKQLTRDAIYTDLKALLAPAFDVLYESQGTDNEHFHAEFDPRHNNQPTR